MHPALETAEEYTRYTSRSLSPSEVNQTDPVFALIAAHRDAYRNFQTALSIPETEEFKVLRDREETRTSNLVGMVETRLQRCKPTTLMGAVAVLRYYLSKESQLMASVDDPQIEFFETLSGALTAIVGDER